MPIAIDLKVAREEARRQEVRHRTPAPAARIGDLLGDFSEQTGANFG